MFRGSRSTLRGVTGTPNSDTLLMEWANNDKFDYKFVLSILIVDRYLTALGTDLESIRLAPVAQSTIILSSDFLLRSTLRKPSTLTSPITYL